MGLFSARRGPRRGGAHLPSVQRPDVDVERGRQYLAQSRPTEAEQHLGSLLRSREAALRPDVAARMAGDRDPSGEMLALAAANGLAFARNESGRFGRRRVDGGVRGGAPRTRGAGTALEGLGG